MSYPYPQAYKDAKEAMAQQEAAETVEAQEDGQQPPRLSSLSKGGKDVPADVREQMRKITDEAEPPS